MKTGNVNKGEKELANKAVKPSAKIVTVADKEAIARANTEAAKHAINKYRKQPVQ